MRSLDWKQLIGWGKNIHGDTSHWLVTKESSIFNARRSTSFFDSVLCLGKILENTPIERCMGTKIWMVQIFFKIQKLRQHRRRADGLRVEYFPQDSISCSSVKKSNVYCWKLGETPENFTGRIIFMSMFNDISCGSKDNEKECHGEYQTRFSVHKKIWKRTMVIYWSWFWKEVVLYQWRQSTRIVGQNGRKDDGGIRRK